MASQMKPRHIYINSANPLTDTFQKAEAEQAAALLIYASNPDRWEPSTLAALSARLKAYMGSAEQLGAHAVFVKRWICNPVFRPNIDRLIADGFAEWVGDETEGRKRPVRFTAAGLKALRLSRWNTCTVTVCSDCFRAACWQGKHYCENYVGAFCVEKTPFQLLALQKSGEAQPEDPSYWDICEECGTACAGKCDG
jgi:hypothetical protein